MPNLKLKLVSGDVSGQKNSCSFTEFGGSIGRAEECDWTLSDADRFISKKHILISFKNQQFSITDVSSNGLIINNANSPLGRDNQYVLQLSDIITIGKYSIQVEDIDQIEQGYNPTQNLHTQPSDSDLFGLVMGGEVQSKPQFEDPFITPPRANLVDEQPTESGLGLHEILSSPLSSFASQNHAKPTVQSNPFNLDSSEQNPFITDGLNTSDNKSTLVSDGLIPDDWDLADMAPIIDDYKSPYKIPPVEQPTEIPPVAAADSPFLPADFHENAAETPAITDFQPPYQDSVTPIENKLESLDSEKDLAAAKATPAVNKLEMRPAAASSGGAGMSDNAFFNALYNKLGLPKEYLASIDTDTFADDIVTILLSTTKGLMALLSSRTAFKQESRLSSTLIQPRSNNPIKFSIDPVDTLEMLLLKKKKGYMSTADSYDEAMEDIQLHQMAFMSGLQATLVGVLNQLNPEVIEKQVNEKGKRLMGLNSNSQCWQLYKEKQQTLAKTVTENLNEVLGNYFSEAYQAQINSFKNNK